VKSTIGATVRIVLLTGAVAGCRASAPPAPPGFDPLAFFTGSSRGEGTLKVLTRAAVPLRVASRGRPDGKNGLILDQIIREGAKPPRQRRWVLRRTSPATLSGTLTDSPGVVAGRIDGNRLLLDFTMKGGLKAEQILTIQPGGRRLVNRMRVRKFGFPVAQVDELITRVD
jgi:hypothetical protein